MVAPKRFRFGCFAPEVCTEEVLQQPVTARNTLRPTCSPCHRFTTDADDRPLQDTKSLQQTTSGKPSIDVSAVYRPLGHLWYRSTRAPRVVFESLHDFSSFRLLQGSRYFKDPRNQVVLRSQQGPGAWLLRLQTLLRIPGPSGCVH